MANERGTIAGVSAASPGAIPAVADAVAIPIATDTHGVVWTRDAGAGLPPVPAGFPGAPITAFDIPAAATAPVAVAAADATLINVLNNMVVTLNAVGAQAATILVEVLDGAAVIYSFRIGPLAAATSQIIQLDNLDLRNAAINTALTAQFATNPAAGNFGSIAWQGVLAQP